MKSYLYNRLFNFTKNLFLFCCGIFFSALPVNALHFTTGQVTSTKQEAIACLQKIEALKPSIYWPNINPDRFFTNLKNNISDPVCIYPGKGTNFCGYAALSHLFLQDDPLGYVKLMLSLYLDGKATFRRTAFDPSPAIKQQAGQLKYKGILDINPADQLWFLTLAGHYKSYLNVFNRKYDPGDEDLFWASVTYAKFNCMAKELLNYDLHARGADIIRPKINGLYQYIQDKLKTGAVVLYINNRIVYKKDHITVKLRIPTHFIVAEKIEIVNDMISLVYWDYGHRTQRQMTKALLKRIIFGITCFSKSGNDVK